MPHTANLQYDGWDITIRCYHLPRAFDETQDPTYAAMAEMELQASEDPSRWVDPRVQVLNTGDRAFKNGAHCIDELFAETKELIDALRR